MISQFWAKCQERKKNNNKKWRSANKLEVCNSEEMSHAKKKCYEYLQRAVSDDNISTRCKVDTHNGGKKKETPLLKDVA